MSYADTTSTSASTAETPKSFGSGGVGDVRRWAAEISLAKDRFKKWNDQSAKNWDRYRARDKRKASYNCLYANTATIYPHIYNTPPTPDVRRRWASPDELGKAVSETLSRAITYNSDATQIDRQIRQDVLDMLICARGISRVRYVPSMVQVGDTEETGIEENETEKEHERYEGQAYEELESEAAPIEHIQWDMYLYGPGKNWLDVPWFAFKHHLTRDELIDRFGEEKGSKVPLDSSASKSTSGKSNYPDSKVAELFSTACVWEIWDKDERKVLWINLATMSGPLKTDEDPYGFENFFPVPEPLFAIVDSDISSPVSLFEQYEEQANELDKISARINRLVAALKARGIYDPALGTQVTELFKGEENDLIPAAAEVRVLREAGGLERFIWFAPIDKMAAVLQGLYIAREQCKSVIFELTGISDIMRGETDSQETFGAQNLKVAFGKGRVSDMQRNVQRYIRDLIQMQSHIISKEFEIETLKQMTELQYLTEAEYMMTIAPKLAEYQQMAMQAVMMGQQPPPPPQIPPKPVTWEQIDAVLKSDKMRNYRVDIETDSTIAAVQQENLEQLQIGIGAITQVMTSMWPMVQQGVVPFDVAKQFVTTIASKFKMGNQLDDMLSKMQPPAPKADPDEGAMSAANQKMQMDMQKHQMTLQAESQMKQAELQADMQLTAKQAELEQQTATWQQEVQARENAHQQQLELERDEMKAQFTMQLEMMKQQAEADREEQRNMLQLVIAQLNNQRAVEVAELQAGAQLAQSQIDAATRPDLGGLDALI